MNKQKGSVLIVILSSVIIISLVVIGIVMFLSNRSGKSLEVVADSTVTPPLAQSNDLSNIPTPPKPVETNPPKVTNEVAVPPVATSDYLWSVFDQYNNKLKKADYNDYVASEPPSSDLMSPTQFAQLSAFTYNENMKLNKTDFVNKWQDDKQAIFSTNPTRAEIANSSRYTQIKISFINKNGTWEILSINHSGSDQATVLDSDKDGLTNDDETCSKAKAYDPNCVKTDPNKRDTNGNGWWDGIETEMK